MLAEVNPIAKARDISKLVRRSVVGKDGKRYTVYVRPGIPEKVKRYKHVYSPELYEKVRRREPGEGREIKLQKQEVETILSKGIVGFISAGRNPNLETDAALSDEQIAARHEDLRNDLKQLGLAFEQVRGKYGAEEDSFIVFVPEIKKSEVTALGSKYSQDSVIYSENGKNELIYTTGENRGKRHEGSGWEPLKDDVGDYYTEIATEQGKMKFSLNFNFDVLKSWLRRIGSLFKAGRPGLVRVKVQVRGRTRTFERWQWKRVGDGGKTAHNDHQVADLSARIASLPENPTTVDLARVQTEIKSSDLHDSDRAKLMLQLDESTPAVVMHPMVNAGSKELGDKAADRWKENMQADAKAVREIPLEMITAESTGQIRKEFDPVALRELAETIAEQGLLSPILVRPDKQHPGHFKIIAGERRFRALSMLAKEGRIPATALAIVRNVSDKDKDVLQLIENYARVNNTPIEVSDHFVKLVKEHGMKPSEIAKIVGEGQMSDDTVRSYLKLAKLAPELRKLLKAGDPSLNKTAAGILADLPTPSEQLGAYAFMLRNNLTTNQLRAHVREVIANRDSSFFAMDTGFSDAQVAARKELADKNPDKLVGELNSVIEKHQKFIHKFLHSDGARLSALGAVAAGQYEQSVRKLQQLQDEMQRVMNVMQREHARLNDSERPLFRALPGLLQKARVMAALAEEDFDAGSGMLSEPDDLESKSALSAMLARARNRS